MDVKVSVVIPVYNAGKYIISCIESLLAQTLNSCEFIFINDGSIDNSQKVIEHYKASDSRIKLINQENQGVSVARNKGLAFACGEYVGFVDADDYIEKDMFEVLYNAAKRNNSNVIISNFETEIEGRKVLTKYPFVIESNLDKRYIQENILPYFIEADNLNTVCNKIYKNEIIKQNGIKFPVKVALGEDGIFNMLFFSYTSTAEYLNYNGYHYREVKGSATKNIVEKDYFKRALEVYQSELPEILTDNIDTNRVQTLKAIKLIKNVMSYVHVYFTPSKEVGYKQRHKYIKEMIRNNYVREALPAYYNENHNSLGRYEKFIINMIKSKSMFGLYFATTYSRLRNK